MRSLLSYQKRISRLRAIRDPEEFRRLIRLPGEQTLLFRDVAQHWQVRDFSALDPAWRALATRKERHEELLLSPASSCVLELPGSVLVDEPASVIRRAYIERPRGHSKTSDMALQIAWILVAARQPIAGLAAAADRDQATFLYDAIQRLAAVNVGLFEDLQFVQHRIKNTATGSRLDVISSDVKSSFGALPDFVV